MIYNAISLLQFFWIYVAFVSQGASWFKLHNNSLVLMTNKLLYINKTH